MTTAEQTDLRDQIKEMADRLSPRRLRSAADFLRYLDELESEEATAELERIPGLEEDLKAAEEDIAAGRTTPVEELKRKY